MVDSIKIECARSDHQGALSAGVAKRAEVRAEERAAPRGAGAVNASEKSVAGGTGAVCQNRYWPFSMLWMISAVTA